MPPFLFVRGGTIYYDVGRGAPAAFVQKHVEGGFLVARDDASW